MAKQQKLTYSFYVAGVQVEKLTTEHKQRIGDRLSEAMSLYFSNHMDEFVKLKFSGENEDGKSN